MTTTLGIDLASQPKNTAICAIDWLGQRASVVALWKGTDDRGAPLNDELVLSAMRGLHGEFGTPQPSIARG